MGGDGFFSSSYGGNGGGICFESTGYIINSTIVNNIANQGGEGPGNWAYPGKGGGVYPDYYAEAFMINTIIAYIIADTFGTYGNSDLYGTFTGQYNLVKDTDNYVLSGDNNLTGVLPEFIL